METIDGRLLLELMKRFLPKLSFPLMGKDQGRGDS